MPASSIAPSAIDSAAYDELDELMREFPDWKDKHPDIYDSVNPPRYPKNKSGPPIKHEGHLSVQKRSQTLPVTDYRATYKKHKTRPRSNKRPPPTPMDPNPPPMKFTTNQRDEYQPKIQERVKPIIQEGQYHPPASAPFDGATRYRTDFPPKSVQLPQISLRATQASMKKTDAPLDSMTTNKEHYKHWQSQPALAFGDVPVFTGSLLYPDQNRYMKTTTNDTFRGEKGNRAALIKQGDGNIKLEGGTDFHTVSQETYTDTHGARKADIVVHRPEFIVNKRTQFNSKTQTQTDYYSKSGAGRTRAIEPAQPTIDLRFDNSQSLATEQRSQYKGVDTISNPAPKPCKKEDTYEPSTDKMETMTSQKRDYQAIDVVANPPPVASSRHSQKLSKSMPRLDDTTTNKQHYKHWNVSPKKRYDDFHEATMYARRDMYAPPAEKFNTVSTTMDTYQGKYAPVPSSLKPQERPQEELGQHDFSTVYKVEFHSPAQSRKMDKKQAVSLLKELRRRKVGGPAMKVKGSRPGQSVMAN